MPEGEFILFVVDVEVGGCEESLAEFGDVVCVAALKTIEENLAGGVVDVLRTGATDADIGDYELVVRDADLETGSEGESQVAGIPKCYGMSESRVLSLGRD